MASDSTNDVISQKYRQGVIERLIGNYEIARKYFLAASSEDNANAQASLRELYLSGQGVAVDYIKL